MIELLTRDGQLFLKQGTELYQVSPVTSGTFETDCLSLSRGTPTSALTKYENEPGEIFTADAVEAVWYGEGTIEIFPGSTNPYAYINGTNSVAHNVISALGDALMTSTFIDASDTLANNESSETVSIGIAETAVAVEE